MPARTWGCDPQELIPMGKWGRPLNLDSWCVISMFVGNPYCQSDMPAPVDEIL